MLFFCAIAAPISWKKAQFQDSLVWCGWEINFSHDTIQLVSAKLAKLDALIKSPQGPQAHLGDRGSSPDSGAIELGWAAFSDPKEIFVRQVLSPEQPVVA